MSSGEAVSDNRLLPPSRLSPNGCEVELREVTKTYTRTRGRTTEHLLAVDVVNKQVLPGRFVSIIGPSGCGKSTVLEMAAGLRSATTGAVRIDGEAVDGPHPRSAMVFQEDSLLPWRTAQQNIELALEAKGVAKQVRREQARTALEMVGLGGFENTHPRELSGGMKQRVAFARALSTEPGLLLMDEPFASLDQQTRIRLGIELVRLWEQTQATVIFVTHDFNEAVFLSDEVWVMASSPGRIKTTVVVDLARPRDESLFDSPRFHELTAELWNELRSEVGIE